MNLAGKILKLFGWTVEITVPDVDKAIICVAPHTSNWDFVLGELAIRSVGRTAGFLMKSSWFVFPLGGILKAIGGIPVHRTKKKGSLVEAMIEKFRTSSKLTVAIAPEGTRKRVTQWRTGFLRIAFEANVPIMLGAIDAPTKRIFVTKEFHATGNFEADMAAIKAYYRPFRGVIPENFTADDK